MIPARWFGTMWQAPICSEAPPAETPLGEICAYCDKTISVSDSGVILQHGARGKIGDRPFHLACLVRLSDIMPGDEMERFLPD